MSGAEDPLARREAVARVLDLRAEALADAPVEEVRPRAVAGRTLAEDVVADADVPAHDRATMDGFAFAAGEDGSREVVDVEVYPEDDPPSIGPGQAVRVATGAALPPEADAVCKREDATLVDGDLRAPDADPGQHVYRRGSTVAAGERLFAAGERLSPKDAVLLTDLGREAVPVRARPTVGLLATGTEIHEGHSPDRDSPMLAGLAESWGADAAVEGSVPDDFDRVRERVDDLAAAHDVVVTSGGTSVGHKDHAVRALDALGEVEFHGVALRPGRPVAAARLPDHDAVAFAVPGKPVAAHTAAAFVLRPFFTGGAALPTVPATFPVDLAVPREQFAYAVPVTLEGDGDDRTARPLGHVDSPLALYGDTFEPSVLSSSTRATRADGVVLTDAALAAGETVRVVPYGAVE